VYLFRYHLWDNLFGSETNEVDDDDGEDDDDVDDAKAIELHRGGKEVNRSH